MKKQNLHLALGTTLPYFTSAFNIKGEKKAPLISQ